MKFTFTINCDKSAFSDDAGAEIGRILREHADNISAELTAANQRLPIVVPVRDINGNTCGKWEIK